MANEIYSSSYWGNGVCDNTIDWGVVYKDYAGCTPSFNNTYSLAFDGVDDEVLVDRSVFDLFGTPSNYTGDITYSTWFKRSASGIGGLVHLGNQNFAYGSLFGFLFVSDELRIGVANNNRVQVSVPYDNNWHHIFYVQINDGSGNYTLKFYLDGTELYNNQIFISNATGGLGTTGIEFTIGKSSTYEFSGNIDECALWTSDQTSIKDLVYNNGVPLDLSVYSPNVWYRNGDNGTWKSPQWLIPNNINVANSRFSNYSFEYDGVDDSIETTKTAALTTASLSMWVKVSGNFGVNVWQSLASNDDFNQGRYFVITDTPFTTNDAYIGMFAGALIYGKNSASGGIPINDGNWHHLVWTYDGSAGTSASINMYVDGQNQYSNATYSSYWSYEIKFQYFGKATSASNYFAGSMDEVAYFNSVLSASDVTAIYNSGTPTTITGAVAHYRMGEEATFVYNVNPEGTWTIPDAVGSNDGTSNNTFLDTGRVGDAPNSTYGALSFNMDEVDRETDVPT